MGSPMYRNLPDDNYRDLAFLTPITNTRTVETSPGDARKPHELAGRNHIRKAAASDLEALVLY